MALTEQKRARLEKLSDENGIISALAFDQRGALKRSWLNTKQKNQLWLKWKNLKFW